MRCRSSVLLESSGSLVFKMLGNFLKMPLVCDTCVPAGTSGDLGLTNLSLKKPSLTNIPSHSPPLTSEPEAFKSQLEWQWLQVG